MRQLVFFALLVHLTQQSSNFKKSRFFHAQFSCMLELRARSGTLDFR